MTHGYATQARCFHVKYTHRYILYTHTTMRYRCEILNHGIDGYEVWLRGRNQGRSGVKINRLSRSPRTAPQRYFQTTDIASDNTRQFFRNRKSNPSDMHHRKTYMYMKYVVFFKKGKKIYTKNDIENTYH